MQINRRRIRKTFGSRVNRRLGTKLNSSTAKKNRNVRPKTRMKNIINDLRAGRIEHP
jgi:hypothetical protein